MWEDNELNRKRMESEEKLFGKPHPPGEGPETPEWSRVLTRQLIDICEDPERKARAEKEFDEGRGREDVVMRILYDSDYLPE